MMGLLLLTACASKEAETPGPHGEQEPAVQCDTAKYVLSVTIGADGTITAADGVGKQGCSITVLAANPSVTGGTLKLTFTRNQGASTKDFSICRGNETLNLPLSGSVSATSCVVNPGLFGLLAGTTHGKDDASHMGFDYVAKIGTQAGDPTLVIER